MFPLCQAVQGWELGQREGEDMMQGLRSLAPSPLQLHGCCVASGTLHTQRALSCVSGREGKSLSHTERGE